MKCLLPALLSLALCSCANYQMGSTPKGPGMTDIKVIYLPTVQNETDETDIPSIVSNAILQEIDRDGTFRHGRKDASDAILEVTVKKIERVPIRQSTEQFLKIMPPAAESRSHNMPMEANVENTLSKGAIVRIYLKDFLKIN